MTDSSKIRLLFIVNPISGNGKAAKIVPLIKKQFDLEKFDITIKESEAHGHASEITKDSIALNYNVIISIGGDGTINEIGKELIGTDILLGIVPAGSGNGLARHLQIPMNPLKALETIEKMEHFSIDTASLNENVFLNVAGIGFDSAVSAVFASGKSRGWYSYLFAIIKLFRKIPVYKFKISWNGNEQDIETVMLSFANSSQFGNNARIAPKANIKDGKLDICIVSKMNFFEATSFAIKMMTGNLKPNNKFEIIQASDFIVNGEFPTAHVDGEPIQVKSPAHISVNPSSLKVICTR